LILGHPKAEHWTVVNRLIQVEVDEIPDDLDRPVTRIEKLQEGIWHVRLAENFEDCVTQTSVGQVHKVARDKKWVARFYVPHHPAPSKPCGSAPTRDEAVYKVVTAWLEALRR